MKSKETRKSEEEARKLEKNEMDWLVIALRNLHPHLCMMTQFEKDLINNIIQKFRLYGNDILLNDKQLDIISKIAKKLRLE